jgi:hypothetical protein
MQNVKCSRCRNAIEYCYETRRVILDKDTMLYDLEDRNAPGKITEHRWVGLVRHKDNKPWCVFCLPY